MFHNGRPLYRFNHSEHSLERYNEFLSHLSGIQPENISVHLLPADLQGTRRAVNSDLTRNCVYIIYYICMDKVPINTIRNHVSVAVIILLFHPF